MMPPIQNHLNAAPSRRCNQDERRGKDAELAKRAAMIGSPQRVRFSQSRQALAANTLGHLANVWHRRFDIFSGYMERPGWSGCLQLPGFRSFANLAQHEQHVSPASQRPEQKCAGQRLELLRSHPEALDGFMVSAKFFEDFVLA